MHIFIVHEFMPLGRRHISLINTEQEVAELQRLFSAI